MFYGVHIMTRNERRSQRVAKYQLNQQLKQEQKEQVSSTSKLITNYERLGFYSCKTHFN